MFKTQSTVEPAIVIVERDENHPQDEPVEYLEIVRPLKKKQKKYLTGERLLIKMNKEQEKKNSRAAGSDPDIDKLTISVNRILKDF